MSQKRKMEYPLLLWPFVAVWSLLAIVISIIGRLLAMIFGLVLTIIGIGLVVTSISVPIGIPVAILGSILMIRSMF